MSTEQDDVNPLRRMMVENVIKQNFREPLTVDALKDFFPPDFDLGLDDLQPHIDAAATAIEFEGEPEALPPQARAVAAANVAAEPVATEPEAPPATPEAIERATVRRLAADQALANARVAVISAQNVERDARGKLAKAVGAFQSGFPQITREQLMRDMIASEQARKAAGHTSHPQSRPGKSVVDRVAFYGRGGNPARGDYRRGAFPSQAFGAPNHDPRRGAVAAQPKVPSER